MPVQPLGWKEPTMYNPDASRQFKRRRTMTEMEKIIHDIESIGGITPFSINKKKQMNIKILNHNESFDICQLCGKEDALRPYGPNKEWICFSCGMKNEETTRAQFEEILSDADVVVLSNDEIYQRID